MCSSAAWAIFLAETGLWPSVEPPSHPSASANARGSALVLRGVSLALRGFTLVRRGHTVGLGARQSPRRRAALRLHHSCRCSGPRSRPRGVALVLRGVSLVLRGCALVLRGRSVALCCPSAARASQCIRTNDPYRGALPPACWPPPVTGMHGAGAMVADVIF